MPVVSPNEAYAFSAFFAICRPFDLKPAGGVVKCGRGERTAGLGGSWFRQLSIFKGQVYGSALLLAPASERALKWSHCDRIAFGIFQNQALVVGLDCIKSLVHQGRPAVGVVAKHGQTAL